MVAFACMGSAYAADIAFSSSTPLTFTDTQRDDNGTVDRIGTGTGTLSLRANNSITGNTTVSNGVLEVASTGKLHGGGYTATPTITVASGATLCRQTRPHQKRSSPPFFLNH